MIVASGRKKPVDIVQRQTIRANVFLEFFAMRVAACCRSSYLQDNIGFLVLGASQHERLHVNSPYLANAS